MKSDSSIPGAKPPPAPIAAGKQGFDFKNVPVTAPLKSTQPTFSQGRKGGLFQQVEDILNRPTADIGQEASVVASVAIDESKTVGGLGLTAMAIFAIVAASPWSWIAALFFGPMRVWSFFNNAVLVGIGTFLGWLIWALMLVGLLAVLLVGWLIFR
jgi:hypothetical protein